MQALLFKHSRAHTWIIQPTLNSQNGTDRSAQCCAWGCMTHSSDALPLYRQEVVLNRIGTQLPRETLANGMIKAGHLIQPVINLLHDRLLACDIIQMDETPVQVLKEPDKSAQSTSYLWLQRACCDPSCFGHMQMNIINNPLAISLLRVVSIMMITQHLPKLRHQFHRSIRFKSWLSFHVGWGNITIGGKK